MKLKSMIIWFFVLLAILITAQAALGAVVINEVMYNPSTSQGDDTDLEWIELYNNGATPVVLNDWTIDSNDFDDATLGPGEYIIVAKELNDGIDADINSYEAYYGNGDGIWDVLDGSYTALDGDFSLTNTGDLIILTNGLETEILTFDPAWGGNGNGQTIEKIDNTINDNTIGNWQQGISDGTPGADNNDAPTAADNTVITNEDIIYSFTATDFYFADADASDSLQSVQITSLENVGSLTLSGADVTLNQVIPVAEIIAGNLAFTPNPDKNGVDYDSFSFSVNDGLVDSVASYTMTIDVTAVNDAPVITAQSTLSTEEDTELEITLDDLTVTDDDNTYPADFTLTVQTGTDYTVSGNTITPATNFNGDLTVPVIVNDGTDDSAQFDLTVTVTAVNDAPTAVDDNGGNTDEDSSSFTTINVLTNDNDIDGDTLSVESFDTSLTQGIVIKNDDGTFNYDPPNIFQVLAVGETATDSFTYTVSDGNGRTDTATVTITIYGVNDPPMANGDTVVTDEESALSINLASDLLPNDYDIDTIDILSVVIDSSSTRGTLTDNGDGTFNYDPNGQFEDLGVGEGGGIDSFTYTLSDGNGGTATATVFIIINGVNDAPVANDDIITTNEDDALNINLLLNDNDIDGDTLRVESIDTSATQGTVDSDGTSYNPNNQFENLAVSESATDSFIYTVSDGNGGTDTATVTITINGVNDEPIASTVTESTTEDTEKVVTLSCTDVDSQAVSCTLSNIVGGTETQPCSCTLGVCTVGLTPTENSVADITADYVVNDGSVNSNTATITVTVTPANDAPVANDDPTTTDEDTLVSVDVLANDEDADGDTLTIDSVTVPAHGTTVINTGNVDYTPAADYAGTDSFTYTVSDGHGGTATATVTITINEVNDAPVITALANQEAVEDVEFSLTITATDVDNPLADLYLDETNSNLGWLNADRLTLRGTPTQSDIGTTTITVFVTDGTYISEPQEFNVTILPALEIEREQVSVIISNSSQELDELTVHPGDEITIDFSFVNNFDERLDHVEVSASALGATLTGLPYTGTCQGTNCAGGYWVLMPGDSGSEHLAFTVPYNIPALTTSFTLTLEVNDGSLTSSYSDTLALTFAVEREEGEVVITSPPQLSDEELVCNSETTLTLNLANTGSNPLEPEVLIYDKEAVESSFNRVTGKFTSFVSPPTLSLEETLSELAAGASNSETLSIDTSNLSVGNHRLYIYLVNPYFNEEEYFIGDKGVAVFTKRNCLQSLTPTTSPTTTTTNVPLTFTATLAESGNNDLITWFVNDTQVASGINIYIFSGFGVGDYPLRVEVDANGGETQSRTVRVVNRFYSESFTHNIPADAANLASFSGLVLENSYAKIAFTQAVDLSSLNLLDDLVIMEDSAVAINSATTPGLNQPATVTIKNFVGSNPIIFRNPAFPPEEEEDLNTFIEGFEECTACNIVSNTNNQLVFTVPGFSTYLALNEQVPDLTVPTEIFFDQAPRGSTANVTFNVQNIGTVENLTGLSWTFELDSKYSPVPGTTPTTLTPLETAAITLRINVPQDEATAKHQIGTVTIRSPMLTSNKTIPVYLKSLSLLAITQVEINGKVNGKLSVEEVNEIEVEVKNNLNKDMEDLTITAELLDVDGEDLEEESDEFDLDAGDNEKKTLEFDLSNEEVGEQNYQMLITVQGEDEDGNDHEDTLTLTLSVERENHRVIIKKTTLSSAMISCLKDTSLQVTVENIGTSDEDEVEIKVKNAALGIDLSRKNLELNDYTDEDDNEETATFNLDLEEAAPGTYQIEVEVYRDDKKEDSETVTLEVKECSTAQTSSQRQTTTTSATSDLQRQLQEQLDLMFQAQQYQGEQEGPVVKASFRESNTYLLMIGSLVFLIFIAVVLLLAVTVKKR